MSLLSRIAGLFSTPAKPPAAAAPRFPIQARIDNATTTDENSRNWWASDYLSVNAAHSFAVRRTLRMRSRHEVSNNPYLFGIVNSNADDLINSGPTFQSLTSNTDRNRQIERAWNEWAEEINLVGLLKTIKLAKTVDGEGFLILKTVESMEHSVKLWPVDIEADQVTTLAPQNLQQMFIDGVDVDPVTFRPIRYHVMKQHPGDLFMMNLNPYETENVPARHVVHWISKYRPRQVRGIPVFTPSLDLFTELRSFRKSTVTAAQIAANHAAVLETEAPADQSTDQEDDPDAFKRYPIERGSLTQLPWGVKMHQMVHQNPSTTYDMFQRACLQEACRPLGYPLIAALGAADKFNFSSAKLDIENYREKLEIERVTECEKIVLEKLFKAWVDEAIMVPGLLPSGINSHRDIPHAWFWPGFKPLDAMQDAQADIARMAAGQDTWQAFWARRGLDWRDVLRQQSEAKKELDKLELVFGEPVRQWIRDPVKDQDGDPTQDKSGEKKPTKAAAIYDPPDDDGEDSDDSDELVNSIRAHIDQRIGETRQSIEALATQPQPDIAAIQADIADLKTKRVTTKEHNVRRGEDGAMIGITTIETTE